MSAGNVNRKLGCLHKKLKEDTGKGCIYGHNKDKLEDSTHMHSIYS